jgi:hypothetical protein
MAFCALDDQQKYRLLKKIISDIRVLHDTNQPFNLIGYMKKMYSDVKNNFDKKKNPDAYDLALTYAGLIPQYLEYIVGVDDTITGKIIESLPAAYQLKKSINDDIKNLETILDLNKKQESAIKEVPKVEPKPEPKTKILPEVFSARPNTLASTTGNSEEPGREHSYNFLNYLADNEKTTSDLSGFYVTLRQNNGLISGVDNKALIQVVTNNLGEPVLLDNDYKESDSGKYVYFFFRSDPATIQTLPEIAKTRNISIEEAEEVLAEELKEVEKKKEFILSSPKNQITQEIIGLSTGYIPSNNSIRRNLGDPQIEDLSELPIEVKRIKIVTASGQEINTISNNFIRGANRASISFAANPVESDQEFLDAAVNILLGNFELENGDRDTPESRSLIEQFIDTFFRNNKFVEYELLNGVRTLIITTEKNSYTFSSYDKMTDEEKEQAKQIVKQALTTYTDKGIIKKHAYNILKASEHANGVPYFERVNDKLIVKPRMLSAQQYRKFLQNHTWTSMIPLEDGTFKEVNGYLIFKEIPEEQKQYVQSIKFKQVDENEPVVVPKPKTPGSRTTEDKRVNVNVGRKVDIKNIGKPKNKLKYQKESDVKATEEQIAKAKAWYLNHPLSKYVGFEEFFDLVNSENPNAAATASFAGITLFNGSDYSDLYHEAWHVFTGYFLSKKEKADLYNEVRNTKGTFTTHLGKIITFKDATDLEVEEFLAEEFRTFMLNGQKFKGEAPKRKTIFQKIFEILQILFSSASIEDVMSNSYVSSTVKTLFEQLSIGNLGNRNFDVNKSDFGVLNKIRPLSEEEEVSLDYAEAKLVIDSIDAIISQIIDEKNLENSTERYTTLLLGDIEYKAQLYDAVYLKLTEALANIYSALDDDSPKRIDRNKLLKRKHILETAIINFSGNHAREDNTVTKEDILEALRSGKGTIAYHMQRSKYVNFDDNFSIDDAEEQMKNTNKDSYAQKSGNEIAMKELASAEVLYTIRTLFKYKPDGSLVYNELGFPELVDFDTVWNKLQRNLEGIYNPIDQVEAITALSRQTKDNSLMQLLSKLGPVFLDFSTGTNLGQLSLWTNFANVIASKKIPLVQLTVNILQDEKGKYSGLEIKPGNAKLESSGILKIWETNFQQPDNMNPYIRKAKDDHKELGKKAKRTDANYLMLNKIIMSFEETYLYDPIHFLRALGMDIPFVPTINSGLRNNFGGFLSALMEKIKHYEKNGIKVTSISKLINDAYKGNTLATSFKQLLDLVYRYSDEYGGAMVSNAKGDPQYEYSLRSTISTMIDSVNKAQDFNSISEKRPDGLDPMVLFNPERNPFIKNLRSVERLFGKGYGKRVPKSRIELKNSSGISLTINDEFSGLGIASSEADEISYTLQNLYTMVIYGVSEGTRHSDKATTYLYRIVTEGSNHNFPIEEFVKPSYLSYTVVNQYVKYLASEIERIHRLNNGDPTGDVTVGDNLYKNVGNDFIIFQDILTPETKQKLLDKYISENFLREIEKEENTSLRETIQKEIEEYLNDQINKYKEDLVKMGFYQNEALMNSLVHSIRKKMNYSYLEELKASGEIDDINSFIVNSIISGYVVNDWVHKYESTAMFYGDPALYNMLKEEFHKRNSSIAATGTIPRTDDAMIHALNTPGFKGTYAQSKWYTGNPTSKKDFSDVFDSVVFSDSKRNSIYRSIYEEAFVENQKKLFKERTGKEPNAKEVEEIKKDTASIFGEYSNMKEGDAQGWITFDAYRDLLISLGKWSPYQDELYHKIINGENIDHIDIKKFFPVKKMQYAGPLATSVGLPAIGFHKFSLFPLVPNVIKGTTLEKLHNKLVENKVDYALFQTGSKVSTITNNGKLEKFYNPDGSIAFEKSEPFIKNSIFLRYFKDQLETHDSYKGKIIFSTQLRKLIEEGLMENGVPVDYKPHITDNDERYAEWSKEENKSTPFYDLALKYENQIRILTDFKKRELEKEAGLTYDKEGNAKITKDFIDFVKKELTRQELADHEIDFIDYNPVTGGLKNDLSIHPNAENIERLLTAMVFKRLVRQKTRGEALIQVSGAGFEKGNMRKATEEEQMLYNGTNELPFYHPGKDGKTKAMKVKIAMQGNFKKLLYHPAVKDLIKIKTLTEDGKYRSMTRLEALNSLLRNPEWVEENRDLITIGGVRIPVQGLNSMEFAEVYEFLPENAGNIVVLPSEIVAKAGSDFDIDKMYFIFPSLTKTITGVRKTKYVKENENLNKEELRSQLNNLYQELENVRNRYEDDIRTMINEDFDFYKLDASELKREIKILKNQILDSVNDSNVEVTDDLYESLYHLENQLFELTENVISETNWRKLDYAKEHMAIVREIDDIQSKMDSGSAAGLENNLLDTIVEILSLPTNFLELITPNGTFLLQDSVAKYGKYNREYNQHKNFRNKEAYKQGSKKVIAGTRIFEIGYNRYKQSSNNVGKATLGQGAVDNTYNVIFNRVGAYMSPTVTLGTEKSGYYTLQQTMLLPHNTINGNISLSHFYDTNKKNKISTLIGQLINGWVDVAKDAWIFDIQGNKELTSSMLFMLQAGVPIEHAVALLSQPMVRDYLKKQQLTKSTFAPALGLGVIPRTEFRTRARAMVLKSHPIVQKQLGKGLEKLDSNYTQSRTIFNTLLSNNLNKELDKEVFTLENLNKRLDEFDGNLTEEDLKVFLHFLEIEEMSKAVTQIKMNTNFDTSRSTNMYEAKQKLDKKIDLVNNRRFPYEIVRGIDLNSPIGSFEVQGFAINFLSNFFKLRNHPRLVEFVEETVESLDPLKTFGAFFGTDEKTKEKFAEALRNDFLSYAFQEYIDNIEFDPKKPYKSLRITNKEYSPVEKEVISETVLQNGAFVKDGNLYVDLIRLERDFKNQIYSKPTYRAKGLSPIEINLDPFRGNFNEYVKFIYEREFLRSEISFTKFKETREYQKKVKMLDSMYEKNKGETDSEFKKRTERYLYEDFLRDFALLSKFNIVAMMYSPTGFANQVVDVISHYPELTDEYSLLKTLLPSRSGAITNLKFTENKLTPDKANIYHEQLIKLADPNVKKVENEIDNDKISMLFNMFPMFAFYQSGQDRMGAFAINRIVNTDLMNMLMEPIKRRAERILSSNESKKYLDQYKAFFVKLYKEPVASNNENVDADQPIVNKARKRIKKYFAEDKTKGFFYGSVYSPKVFFYTPKTDNVKAQPKQRFAPAIKTLIDNVNITLASQPNALFIYDDFIPGSKNKLAYMGANYSNTVLRNAAETIDVTVVKINNKDKEVKKPMINPENIFGIPTKKGALVSSIEDIMTDETYSDNIKLIEDAIMKLKEQSVGKIIVFDERGVGNSLLGYTGSESLLNQPKIPDAPGYKTYMYLSKRLYEEFQFINPYFYNSGEFGKLVKKEDTPTNREVNNTIFDDVNNLKVRSGKTLKEIGYTQEIWDSFPQEKKDNILNC